MNKDFEHQKLNSFDSNKIIKILLDLATFIETKNYRVDSSHFLKLSKYHFFLKDHKDEYIQKLNKEFRKVKALDYQFQIYIMNLERLMGQSSKEYDFLVDKNDKMVSVKSFDVICILDSIRSAHNIGSMFRNAECFGSKKIFLTGLSPNADHAQVQKTAMGSTELVDFEYRKSALELVKELKNEEYTIIAVETIKNSLALHDLEVDNKRKFAFIFGHEQHGISLELIEYADQSIHLPLYGRKNSLNVSICQAIVLQEVCRKLNDTK